jgi:hypothetical protein
MDPMTLILIAYLEVAQCMGIQHPRPLPPKVVYVPTKWLKCSFGKCSGKYWGPPVRKIKIAVGRSTLSLLKHEFVHDLLMQRDRHPDAKHRDPAFLDCVH